MISKRGRLHFWYAIYKANLECDTCWEEVSQIGKYVVNNQIIGKLN